MIVVPIFAPMTIGTAASTVRAPAPTNPTIVEVDTDEDCTSTVARIPAHKPASGLSTLSSNSCWKSAPSQLMPRSSAATPTRKRYSITATKTARMGRGSVLP